MRIDMTRIRNRRVHTALHPIEDKLLGDAQVKNHTLVGSGGNDRRPESSHSQELALLGRHTTQCRRPCLSKPDTQRCGSPIRCKPLYLVEL